MFTKCLIVENQTMFAEVLAISLSATGLVASHAIATSLGDAGRIVRRETFDLVVSDLLFPEGNSNDFIGALTRLKSPPRILVVTSLHDPWHLQSMLKYPVDAILSKGEPFQSLRERLEGLMPPGPKKPLPVDQVIVRIGKLLSKREQEVLCSVGGGSTNQEIAEYLGLSVRTVETHRKNISNKLKIRAGELFRAAVHFRDASAFPWEK
jgi:DNA-binding NarL/FixJ family response regulator